MKRRKILTITLALAYALAFTVPAFASEGTDISPVSGQEETVQPQPPEEVPDTPEEAPDAPEEVPDVPAEEPDVPVEDPDAPAEGPDAPVEDPDAPEEDPDAPAEDPDAPAENPDAPVEDPDAPEEDPDAPAEDPDAPVEDPDAPAEDPDAPVEDPDAPEEDPDAPAEDPNAPEELPGPLDESGIIDVLVPDSGQVIINPYRMKIAGGTSGETTDQIVHEAQELVNYTGFPVEVSAHVAGNLRWESSARFVSAPPAEDASDKQIFMYVEFQPEPYLWSGVFGDWSNQILVTAWGEEKDAVLTLDPFGVGYFRLSGAMTPFPDTMWSAEDAPDVTLAFTFSPIIPDYEPVAEAPVWDLWDAPADGGPAWDEPEDFYGPEDVFYGPADDGSAYISEVF